MKSTRYTEDVRVLNDGVHSTRALNTVRELFTTHDLKKPILYQFIASGSQDKSVYQEAMKAIMRHIRTQCRAEYIGAYEVGEEKNGLHIHAFVIIETVDHFPSDLLDVSEGEFLDRLRKRKKISLRIEPPKNRMHGGAMFARMNTPAKLENCINWATYILKLRSKGNVPGRETYFGSEFVSNMKKREAKRQKYRDALTKSSKPAPANEESISLESGKVVVSETGKNLAADEVTISPTSLKPEGDELNAGDKYIAAKYETAVGMRLDLEAIRIFLLSHGIKRSPAQVEFDLDERYGFYGYAASHPVPRRLTYAEIDRELEQPSRIDREVPLPPYRSTDGRGNIHRQGTI